MGCFNSTSIQTTEKIKTILLKPCLEDNYILTVFHVDDDKLESEKIQIINQSNEIEKQLKGNCNIYVNDKIIDFSFNSEFK